MSSSKIHSIVNYDYEKIEKNFMKGDYFSVVKLPWEQTFYDSGLSQVNLIQQGKN